MSKEEKKEQKIKVEDIVNSYDTITFITNSDIEDGDFVYEWTMLQPELENINKSFTKVRDSALTKFGEPIKEAPGKYALAPEKVEDYSEMVNAVLEKPVDITFPTIPYEKISSVFTKPQYLRKALDLGIVLPKKKTEKK